MFDELSRYKDLVPYHTVDARGREVLAVPAAPDPQEQFRGFHLLKQQQRMDHLAYRYLKNGAGAWRIYELNDVMLPDALAEVPDVAIPK